MDLALLFRFMPDLYLILDTQFNIVDFSQAYENATMIKRKDSIGCYLFNIFPDNPADRTPIGVHLVTQALKRVIKTKQSETLSELNYDITRQSSQNGQFEERYWNVMIVPILDDAGKVSYLLLRIENVTELVKLKQDHQQKQAIVATNTQLQLLISSMQDAYVASNEYSEIVDWNKQAESMFGWTKAEILGKSLVDTIIPARFKQPHLKGMQHYIKTGEGPVLNKRIELAGRDKQGKEFPIEITITNLFFNQSHHFYAFIHDISDRKQFEEQLKQTLIKLQRSNVELEQFAYIASHDLQEPLRMVVSFTQLLERRYKDLIDQDGKDFIHYAVDGAQRMQTLLKDLLIFSRATHETRVFERESMDDVLNQVLSNLAMTIEEKKARITHDPLPMIYVDKSQMVRLMQNLIINGIKFQPEGQQAHIHISAILSGDNWLFSVQDNGIGIEAQYLDKIFIVFKRLHARAMYEGTGIGLAVCKKIIERHHGSIWAQSEVGQGTTIYFTLPNKENAA